MPSISTIKTWRALVSCSTNKSLSVEASAWRERELPLLYPIFFQPHSSCMNQLNTLLPRDFCNIPAPNPFVRLSPNSSATYNGPSTIWHLDLIYCNCFSALRPIRIIYCPFFTQPWVSPILFFCSCYSNCGNIFPLSLHSTKAQLIPIICHSYVL